jgi:dynein heavy chain, axonemal
MSPEEVQKSISEKESHYELVVPTKDTVRYSWLLKMNLICGNPVFLTGVSGVGKSIICQSTLQNLQKAMNYQVINLSFSSQTSAVDT